VAEEQFSAQAPLYANGAIPAEPGGALVWRTDREANTRCGVFHSVPEFIDTIYQHLDGYNENPRSFVWTAKTDDILKKVSKCKAILETLH